MVESITPKILVFRRPGFNSQFYCFQGDFVYEYGQLLKRACNRGLGRSSVTRITLGVGNHREHATQAKGLRIPRKDQGN